MLAPSAFVADRLKLTKNFLHIQGAAEGFYVREGQFYKDQDSAQALKSTNESSLEGCTFWLVNDLCEEAVWQKIHAQNYDAIIITGALEFVRDPVFVCKQLIATCKRGYIESTSRFREASRLADGNAFAGNLRAHWIVCGGDKGSLQFRRKGPWSNLPDILALDHTEHLGRFWHQFSGFFWDGSFEFFELEPKSFEREAADLRYFFNGYDYENKPDVFQTLAKPPLEQQHSSHFLRSNAYRLPVEMTSEPDIFQPSSQDFEEPRPSEDAHILNWDGERFIPGAIDGNIDYEHTHRYALASRFAAGKIVADIASGEGYGSALLADVAQAVTGVDIAPNAIEHATKRYAEVKNLSFICDSCENLDVLEDASFDLITSFETIEHVEKHDVVLDNFLRILKKNGILIISSPDKDVYTGKYNQKNHFHLKELTKAEFLAILKTKFKHVLLLDQVIRSSSLIWDSKSKTIDSIQQVFSGNSRSLQFPAAHPSDAVYNIALCSNDSEIGTDFRTSILVGEPSL